MRLIYYNDIIIVVEVELHPHGIAPTRNCTHTELHPHGIAPKMNCTHKELHPYFKKCIKYIDIPKNFFLKFFFLYLIYFLGEYFMNKMLLATTNSILRKWVLSSVGAIPSEPSTTNNKSHCSILNYSYLKMLISRNGEMG